MSTPKYVTLTLSEHEANLVIAGLLRQGRAIRESILEGEAQGMDDAQLRGLASSRDVSQALMERIVEALR